jgi:hypothetical protein
VSFLLPKQPSQKPLPAAPTIDDAGKNRDELDRMRRRRGVLANIFAGAQPGSAASPSVGVQTLGGGQ